MNCIFCKIISGEIPSFTIYEDDIVKVLLDVNPDTNGHTLIIPKNHYENLSDIDEDVLHHINSISKRMYCLLKEKLHCEGLTIIQNNDYGQAIKHYHMHLVPRYKDDQYALHYNKKIVKDPKEIYELITNK